MHWTPHVARVRHHAVDSSMQFEGTVTIRKFRCLEKSIIPSFNKAFYQKTYFFRISTTRPRHDRIKTYKLSNEEGIIDEYSNVRAAPNTPGQNPSVQQTPQAGCKVATMKSISKWTWHCTPTQFGQTHLKCFAQLSHLRHPNTRPQND
jgi:hypothetical protein